MQGQALRQNGDIDVSVIIMSYNNAAFLGQAIESCLAQEGVSLEVIVVDDRSQDESLEIIRNFLEDYRFSYSVNERNLGQTGNYNYCVRQGRGRYVVVLGSDDLLYPGHLKSLCQALDALPLAMLAYTLCNWIDQDGQLIQCAIHAGHKSESYFGGRDEIVDLLTYDCYVTPSAAMLRRSMLDDVALENGNLAREGMMAGDWELWLRIARVHPDFVFIRQASVGYRIHAGQVSMEFYADARPLYEHTTILEHCLGDGETLARMRVAPLPIWRLYQKRLNAYPVPDRQKILDQAQKISERLFEALTPPVSVEGPLFSVIVTITRAPERVLDILACLQAQVCHDFEVILVNVRDKMLEPLPVEVDFPLMYAKLPHGSGLSAARNAGLKLARGRYVVCLSDEGVYLPDHLQALADKFEKYPESIVYSDALHIIKILKGEHSVDLFQSRLVGSEVLDCDDLFVHNHIPVNTWAFPRAAVFRFGNFDTGLSVLEDWDMLLRLVQSYPVYGTKQVTVENHQWVTDEEDTQSIQLRNRNSLLPFYQKLYALHPVARRGRIQAERNNILSGQPPSEHPWDVEAWLSDRTPSVSRIQSSLAALRANPSVSTLGIVIIAGGVACSRLLLDTLDSLKTQHRPVDAVWLIGDQGIQTVAVQESVEILNGMTSWPQRLSDRILQGHSPGFLWVLHAGDKLVPHATLTMSEYRMRQPDALIWYADEVMQQSGAPSSLALKPDFNADLLCSYPYVGRNLIVSSEAIRVAGGLDEQMADLALVDLLWRVVEQQDQPLVGHVPEVLQHMSVDLMAWAQSVTIMNQSAASTNAHLDRAGTDAQVSLQPALGVSRVDYRLTSSPLVSIILPASASLLGSQVFIQGLKKHTGYVRYELLVMDRGDQDSDALDTFSSLEEPGVGRVRLLCCPQAINPAMVSNFAAAQAQGEILLFLGDDIRFSDQTRSDWLERLLVLALRPEVGMAGSRLNCLDGKRVDQCGQILGLNNGAGAGFRGESADAFGYMSRLVAQQNVSALSASCLVMRKTVFDQLGGFDAGAFPDHHYDIDLCLKATRAGYLLALEPDTGLERMGKAASASMVESLQAAADDEHSARLRARWLPQLVRDPNYHPAFKKYSPGFRLSRNASRLEEPLPGRPLPVVLAAHVDWQGSSHYRILHPFEALMNEFRLDGGFGVSGFDWCDAARIRPDVIVLQGAWQNEEILAQIRRYREIMGVKIVLEFDDYFPNLPTRSLSRIMQFPVLIKKMHALMEHVDWLVVSTPMLAREYEDYHPDVRVAMNGLLPARWGNISGQRRAGKKMRVGWACSSSYAVDLAVIYSVIKELQDEVEWVFLGDKSEGVLYEHHRRGSMENYPEKLASLNLDLAVAPFQENSYNRCKSNLNILELGACGVPVICTDVEAYRGSLPVTRVTNRHEDWIDAIRSHISDSDGMERAGDELRNIVMKDWMLQGSFLDQWIKAWGV